MSLYRPQPTEAPSSAGRGAHLGRWYVTMLAAVLTATLAACQGSGVEGRMRKGRRLKERLVPTARPQRNRWAGTQLGPEVGLWVRTEGNPYQGSPDAEVTVIAVMDPLCPYCKRARDILAQVRAHYGDSVKIVWKIFAASPQSLQAASAACAAHEQGKFWELEKELWKHQDKLRDQALVDALAEKVGVDMVRYREDRANKCRARIRRESDYVRSLGIAGTPAFFVNGRYLPGVQPLARFKAVIDEELNRREASRTASGVGREVRGPEEQQ